MSEELPSVLILGGITSFACDLTALLLSSPPKISHLRIVDKVSVSPATTYIPPAFLKALEEHKGRVEYRQANLTIASVVAASFEPPEGKPAFSIVYDLTGEKAFDKAPIIHMTSTLAVAILVGAEAERRHVRSFVRVCYPWYEMKGSEKGGYKENVKLLPDGDRGKWTHEALRALAAFPKLNLVLLRIGAEYGPNCLTGVVTPRIVCGEIYRYLKEDMKLLWSADLKIHTIHVDDVCAACVLGADWIGRTGRESATREHGIELAFSGVDKESLADLPGACTPKASPRAPLFNIVDDDGTTQDKIASAVSRFFGIKHDYYGAVTALFAKLSMKSTSFEDMVDDANEMHVDAWAEMAAKNLPPIENSPLTPYLDAHEFQKLAINLDGSLARKVLGFWPAHKGITQDEVGAIVRGFQDQGLWPRIA